MPVGIGFVSCQLVSKTITAKLQENKFKYIVYQGEKKVFSAESSLIVEHNCMGKWSAFLVGWIETNGCSALWQVQQGSAVQLTAVQI